MGCFEDGDLMFMPLGSKNGLYYDVSTYRGGVAVGRIIRNDSGLEVLVKNVRGRNLKILAEVLKALDGNYGKPDHPNIVLF